MPASALSLSLSALLLLAMVTFTNLAGFSQPVLTGSDQLMTQYESFRVHVARDGHYDLAILGNSVARKGVDIAVLLAELGEPRGAPLRAYNFAAGGVSSHTLPFAAKLLYAIDDPQDCVIVMTPDMIAEWSAESREWGEAIRDSPYGRALSDPVVWMGRARRLLLDHVAIVGLRSTLRNRLLGTPDEPRETIGGYDPAMGYSDSPRRTGRGRSWAKARERFSSWELPEEKARGSIEAIRIAQLHGARTWLAEAPLQPRVVAMVPDPVDGMRRARAAIRRIGAITGTPVLWLPSDLSFTAVDFLDARHLNVRGARRYTEWLAMALVEAGFDSPRRALESSSKHDGH